MATHLRSLLYASLTSTFLLCGCATHPIVGCVGDAESLGYRDGSLGQQTCSAAFPDNATVAYHSGWSEGIQRFCTEETGYQQGCQGAPFTSVCPDTLASTYLDGYRAGYAVYLIQLEVDAMERALESKSNELEQVWSMLDAVAVNLEQSDIGAAQRAHWLEESRSLTTRQRELNAQLDELESEISARKAQLDQQSHAIAFSD